MRRPSFFMYVYSYVLSFDIAYRTAESRDGDGVSCFLWIPGYVRCRVASNHVCVARFSKVFTTTTGQPSPNSSDYIPILAPFTHIPSPVLIPARSFPLSGLLLNLVHLTPVPMIDHSRAIVDIIRRKRERTRPSDCTESSASIRCNRRIQPTFPIKQDSFWRRCRRNSKRYGREKDRSRTRSA
jgi:hypothetical protein